MQYDTPYLGGEWWRKFRKKVKKAAASFTRAITPPRHVRRALRRATTPSKAIRKALTPPKAVRKAMDRNPWLGTAVEASIAAIAFIPLPGAQVVSVALDVLYSTAMQGVAIDEQKRMVRRAAHEEANFIAQENALLAAEAQQGVAAIERSFKTAQPYQAQSEMIAREPIPETAPFPWELAAAGLAIYLLAERME